MIALTTKLRNFLLSEHNKPFALVAVEHASHTVHLFIWLVWVGKMHVALMSCAFQIVLF